MLFSNSKNKHELIKLLSYVFTGHGIEVNVATDDADTMVASLFELFELSKRNGKETRLLTPNPSKNFLYVGSVIWNAVRDLIKLYEFSQNSGSAKCVLKREILKIQKGGDPIEWQHGTWNTLQYLRY